MARVVPPNTRTSIRIHKVSNTRLVNPEQKKARKTKLRTIVVLSCVVYDR